MAGPGAFRETVAVQNLCDFSKMNISLDPLLANFPTHFKKSDHWVPAITSFHYDNRSKRNDNFDPFISSILTLADLYCDNVPAIAPSKESSESIITSAKIFFKDFRSLHFIWSNVSVEEYEAQGKKSHKVWPTIGKPEVSFKGSKVQVNDLLEAWAFCFKKPSDHAIREVRDSLWAMVVAISSHGRIDSADLSKAVNRISTIIRYELGMSEEWIRSLATYLMPLMTNRGLADLLAILTQSLSDPLKEEINSIIENISYGCVPKLRTVVLAKRHFPKFPWDHLSAMLKQEESLLSHNMNVICKDQYHWICIRSPPQDTGYDTYADTANELFIRVGGTMRQHVFKDYSAYPELPNNVKSLINSYFG